MGMNFHLIKGLVLELDLATQSLISPLFDLQGATHLYVVPSCFAFWK